MHGGFLVAAAIDKYVYVSANRRFYDTIRLAYSKTETVDVASTRSSTASSARRSRCRGIDARHRADQRGRRAGQLGPRLVELIHGRAAQRAAHLQAASSCRASSSPRRPATSRSNVLKEPIGKQDQYIAAFGGVTAFTFNNDGSVAVERVPIRDEVLDELESNLLIFYSGVERAAASVLSRAGQDHPSQPGRRGRAHAPDQGARPRDPAHPRRRRRSTRTASCCTSTGRTSASSPRT